MNIEKKIKKNEPLDKLTSFKIGGPAKFLVEVADGQELLEAVAWAKKHQEKIFILGGGSNILVNDKGVDGLVIKLANQQAVVKGQKIIAGAGCPLARLVELAKKSKLSGLEWAVGIPGTMGGAVRGNAGAYGGCLADSVKLVKALDMEKMMMVELDKEACQFGYRDSLFKQQTNLIIWEITLLLSRRALSKIKALMDSYWQSRLKTNPGYPSAGCVFKNLLVKDLPITNPICRQARAEEKIKGDKLACGYIIDQLGLKGQRLGGALIGPHHGNFIVNFDKASAADVKGLITKIKQQVKEKFNIDLQEEVQYFGF